MLVVWDWLVFKYRLSSTFTFSLPYLYLIQTYEDLNLKWIPADDVLVYHQCYYRDYFKQHNQSTFQFITNLANKTYEDFKVYLDGVTTTVSLYYGSAAYKNIAKIIQCIFFIVSDHVTFMSFV